MEDMRDLFEGEFKNIDGIKNAKRI